MHPSSALRSDTFDYISVVILLKFLFQDLRLLPPLGFLGDVFTDFRQNLRCGFTYLCWRPCAEK